MYKSLKHLNLTPLLTIFQITNQHSGQSLNVIKQKYQEATSECTFTIDQRNFSAHCESLLSEMEPEETTNDKTMGEAIRTLGRVMSELEEHYKEYQSIMEQNLETFWKWQKFKKEIEQLTDTTEDLKEKIKCETDGDKLNDAYSVLQSTKTACHEASKIKDDLPVHKQKQADEFINNLDKAITENFSELGKKMEKTVNTGFVLNIQGDILSWIKEFEDALCISHTSPLNDNFRMLLEKDTRIRTLLKYCPLEVIEDYFETCQKIGTDFLLASMLGVESCISRLIEKLVETSQQINDTIKKKANTLMLRMGAILDRIKALDDGTEMLVECKMSCEKMLALIGTFSQHQSIELPEIADTGFLEQYKNAPLLNQVEVLDELIQTISKFVQNESEELQLSNFQRSRSISKGKRDTKSPFSSNKSRRDSGKRSTIIAKTTDNYIDDMEEIVQVLENSFMCKTVSNISTYQSTKIEKSTQKLYHILKEFMDTEKVYIKSLDYLHDEIIQKAIADEDFTLNIDVRECLRISKEVLEKMIKLNRNMNSQVRNSTGGGVKFARIFTELGKEFEVYKEFINLQPQLESILSQDYFKNIQASNSDPLSADSYVCKPMQRLCKYKLLFEDALSNTTQVFELPTIYRAVLQSGKLLRSINGTLHLQEEVFCKEETSRFFLYARVSLFEIPSPERKAYLFQDTLYFSKANKEYISFKIENITLLSTDKSRLEMVLNVTSPSVKDGTSNTLKRNTSLRRIKGPTMLTLTFHEYGEYVEWSFKLKNVLGKYY